MSSAVEKSLAKKILSIRKYSKDAVPPERAAAARRVLQDQEQPGDVDMLRKSLGIRRSGASSMRRSYAQTKGLATTASRFVGGIETIGSSSSGFGGASAITDIGMLAADSIVRNRRSLIKVGEGIAKTVGADPTLASKFFNSLSRMARVGGVTAMAVTAGALVVGSYFDTLRKGAEAGKRMSEAFFKFGNRYRADELERKARADINEQAMFTPDTIKGLRERGIIGEYLADIISDYSEAKLSAKSAERMQRLMSQEEKAKVMFSPRADDELIAYAAGKRKKISDLTPQEINSVLYNVANQEIGRIETTERKSSWQTFQVSDMTWWETMMTQFDFVRSRREQEWALALRDKTLTEYSNRMEAKRRAYQLVQENMSSADRLELERQRDTAAASFAAYKSRHRAIIPD